MSNTTETETTVIPPVEEVDIKTVDTKRKKTIIISTVAGVAALALIAGGAFGVHSLRSSKITACENANESYAQAWKKYETVKAKADKTSKTITTAEQVADSKTFTTFTTEYGKTKNTTKVQSLNCSISYTQAFTADTSRLDKATEQLNRTVKALETTVSKVVKSKEVKDLENTKQAVQAKLDEMNNLLSSSNGQVADNATRDNLQNQINAVTAALNDKKATVESLNKALEPVQGVIDGVNASIQQKQQADQAAAQAAAAAQAQAQANSRSYSANRSYTGTRSNNGGSSRSNGSGSSGSSSSAGTFDWRSALSGQTGGSCTEHNNCQFEIG
ncbi:hypothetical protein ACFQY8_01045 [Alloscardovia venturai]|uniref:Colicin transporter n=1 Tax=Alloscardovia venturai TaxID=1769421 RepID=A0ABW2Y241_9BIFI